MGLESHDPRRARPTNSNMVASLAGLRFLLMFLLFCGIRFGACSQEAPLVLGLRVEDPAGLVCMKDRIISAPVGATFKLRLFGTDLNESWPWVAFAGAAGGAAGAVGDAPDPCKTKSNRDESAFQVKGKFTPDEDNSGLITVQVQKKSIPAGAAGSEQTYHHLCVRSGGIWASAGPDRLRVNTDKGLPADHIPPWGLAVLIVLLLLVCGLLRTVNLSLLWLDPVELYVLHSCGSEEEKRAAKRLEPIRRRGNFMVSVKHVSETLLFIPSFSKHVLSHRHVLCCSSASWDTPSWGSSCTGPWAPSSPPSSPAASSSSSWLSWPPTSCALGTGSSWPRG